MTRRTLLLGGWLITLGAAGAYVTPRGGRPLTTRIIAALMPLAVGDWRRMEAADVVPETADTERERSDRTFAQTYVAAGRPSVMMLIAYHGPSSLELKVHRPEVCYQVAGFRLDDVADTTVQLSDAVEAPGRAFTATRVDRTEQVLYWTRLGGAFPRTMAEQRLASLRQGLAGRAVDGLLVRLSGLGRGPEVEASLRAFAGQLYLALPPPERMVLA